MRICVFCGSSPGNNPGILSAAKEFGKKMADRDIELVYPAFLTKKFCS